MRGESQCSKRIKRGGESLASNLEKERIMSSMSLERQHLEPLPGDLLRPLGAYLINTFPPTMRLQPKSPATRLSSSGATP
jgi:hypothetical protein